MDQPTLPAASWGGGEGLHPQRTNLRSSPRFQGLKQVLHLVTLVFPVPLPAGGRGGVNGSPRLFGKHTQTGDVVAVLVGEQDGGQLVRLHAQLRQPGGKTLGGDAGVQQDVGATAGNQRGVAQRAAGKGGKGQQIILSSVEKQTARCLHRALEIS